MESSRSGTTPTQLRVRMVAQPASVPATRRFVDDALTGWGREDLIDDVGLCVSELSTNATLHSGSRFFEVELEALTHAVRVAVLDRGASSLGSTTPTDGYAGAAGAVATPENALATGRGLFIVSALANSWGIDELPEGNRVWAEVSPGGAPSDAHGGAQRGAHTRAQGGASPQISRRDEVAASESEPEDWTVVTLKDCPVGPCLAHDDNLADMIRELQLIGSTPASGWSEPLADLMSSLVQRYAVTWDAGRLIARDAVQDGREYADIHVGTRKEVAADVRALQDALLRADELSRAGELITLPAPPEVQLARAWMADEFVEQTRDGRPPVSYLTWLEQHR